MDIPKNKDDVKPVKAIEGIYRKTLIYNNNVMMCFFSLEKASEIPLHNHVAHQIGYVLKGKLELITENDKFTVKKGDSYVFNSNEKHGAIILEDSEVIEVFNPAREDYK
jgi:quercetin dioxygenase-like cupin family protein